MKSSTQDKAEGTAKDLAGRVKEVLGGWRRLNAEISRAAPDGHGGSF